MDLVAPKDVWDKIKTAAKVHVVDSNGQKVWRNPKDIEPTDKVILKNNSEPITMDGNPGRPTGKKKEPKTDGGVEGVQIGAAVQELIANKSKRRDRYLRRDKLLRTTDKDPDSSDVMDLILKELASEAAALGFERVELENEGKNVSEVSSRRTRILEKTGEIWLKRQERLKDVGVVDMDTPAIKAFMKAIVDTFQESMVELKFRPEAITSLLNKVANRIDDEWKVAVRKKMKKATG
jgi:hypothetical protein